MSPKKIPEANPVEDRTPSAIKAVPPENPSEVAFAKTREKVQEIDRRWSRLSALLEFAEAPDLDSGARVRQAGILSQARKRRVEAFEGWRAGSPLINRDRAAVAAALLLGLALGIAAGLPVHRAQQVRVEQVRVEQGRAALGAPLPVLELEGAAESLTIEDAGAEAEFPRLAEQQVPVFLGEAIEPIEGGLLGHWQAVTAPLTMAEVYVSGLGELGGSL